ncbi:unnamed protein product [Rotaria sordida]|uniref:Uncharacterized protein n=1 Tax=Rotaria sordida TaxID=392033 RepID=A0A815W094_9BILA|nr:unnamed protein product [Rotaria sordida]CAF1494951.1 unnamed protein product [Rotaria sordida]CAF1537220.1 unnamed protein product [Rotaria sordida]CAF4130847.1 unnamed protein product [Rotaria sordida]CAF4157057.1 unnamed protein product [Rotaria sordida]
MSGTTLGMTGSYNTNSLDQMLTVDGSIPFIQEAIDVLDISPSPNPLTIADYGSSHGFNSMYAIKAIIKYLKESNKLEDKKQILVVHNDLPTNHWTILFELLNEDKSYFGVASGRSFYESCLPSNSLSICYSSNSIHWLSRRPCQISKHCASIRAEDNEFVAFQQQARLDLAQFLERRSSELHIGGVLIITIWCTNENGSSGYEQILDLLYKCAQSSTLLTEQEILDYTIPMHIRSPIECLDFELFNRCSFKLIKSTLKKVSIRLFDDYRQGRKTLDECARVYTQWTRSWVESVLRQTLEMHERSTKDIETILDQYWTHFENAAKERPHDDIVNMCDNYLVLKKISTKT